MDMSLFSKKIRISLFSKVFSLQNSQCFLLYKNRQQALSLKLLELKWNLLKRLGGGRKLSKDGLLYIKNKTLTNGRTYWKCAQRGAVEMDAMSK